MDQLESYAHAGKILVRILAAMLIRIKHGQRRRRAFIFIRQVVIGDDYVEPVRARPMQRLVRAYAAIDADHQLVSITRPPSLRRAVECRSLQ